MPRSEFTEQVIALVRSIPEGKVATYGGIAAGAGNPRAARQVVRTLHTFGDAEHLPWHRVVNREGRISLKPGGGYEEQRALLEAEGIRLDDEDRVPLDRYQWYSTGPGEGR